MRSFQRQARQGSLNACRMLKYTPEHMHCMANIYAALSPTNTGVVAIQAAAVNQKVGRSGSYTRIIQPLETE